MGKSKTEKLVRRIVKDEQKRSMYSTAELTYMELQLNLMKLARQKKKLQQKQKGFGECIQNGNPNHKQWNKLPRDCDKPSDSQ